MKIIFKLIFIIVILALVGVIVSGSISFIISKQSIEDRIGAQLKSVAILKANQLNGFIDVKAIDIKTLAESLFVRENLKGLGLNINETIRYPFLQSRVRNFFGLKLLTDKDFFEFFIMDLNGDVIVSTNKSQEGISNRATEQYFINGKEHTYVQTFYYDSLLKAPAITIASPIRDEEWNIIGVLAGRIKLEEISKLMTERSGLGETGETYLVNSLYFFVTDLLKKTQSQSEAWDYTESTKSCIEEKPESPTSIKDSLDYVSDRVIGVNLYIDEMNVCLIAKIDEDEAFKPINTLKFLLFLVSLAIVFLTIIAGVLLSRTISKPIIELKNATNKIAAEKLDTQIKIRSKDEIGELTMAFNNMNQDLKKSRDKLKNSYKKILNLMKAKTDFVNKSAHDLRTPITPILALLPSIKKKIKNKEVLYGIGIIEKNANYLKRIADELIELLKSEQVEYHHIFKKTNIKKLIENVLITHKKIFEERGIKAINNIPNKLPLIELDELKITEVIQNIVSNALKFTPKGGKLTVSARKIDNFIYIEFKDTGIGMTKKTLARVFEEFFKADTSRHDEGSGLGLLICKKIIKGHNGKIRAESEGLNKGSTISFKIPIERKMR